MAEKLRVHHVAKELHVTSKVILGKCAAEGLTVANHMSTLTAGQIATIREWFSEGAHTTTLETSDRVDLAKVRLKPRRKRTTKKKTSPPKTTAREEPETDEQDAAAAIAVSTAVAEPAPAEVVPIAAPADEDNSVAEAEPPAVAATTGPVEVSAEAPATEIKPTEQVTPSDTETAAPAIAAETTAAAEAEDLGLPTVTADAGPAGTETQPADAADSTPPRPVGPQNVPTPAALRGPRVVRYEAPETNVGPPRRGRKPADTGTIADQGVPPVEGRNRRDVGPATEPSGKGQRGRVHPRRGGRGFEVRGTTQEWRDRDLIERKERLRGATGRRMHTRRAIGAHPLSPGRAGTVEPRTHAQVHEPVTMKGFCAATGISFVRCFAVLKREHKIIANINMTLDSELAGLVALEFGIELTIIPAKTLLDRIQEEFEGRERPNLGPRPPVVTMLGHVDHGKTSLLDAIRQTHVADREDGGITQHIGASYVMTSRGAVTFLDTPGHHAFTAMRARGATLTDVVVLVIAADDGVMPQTLEAINHAKAAEVSIVVALNKIDLGRDNLVKIYGQLAEHDLAPVEWGGETDVICTSATSGEGVGELLEHLAELAEVLDLQADATIPATGTVIEAESKEGVGAVARVLVQDGTLRTGDTVVCGNGFGKIRALRDDRGRGIDLAGPSTPVEMWGLDQIPLAGDRFYRTESSQRAKAIAEETAQRRVQEARLGSRKARSVEELFKQRDRSEIPELNVIIKGDVDGSVQVLKKTLSEFPSEDVRLHIRHAGVGAVSDSDVLLADASDAIIVAFRVITSPGSKRLADETGVDIRHYRVIYEVTEDIKKALEGLLQPEEQIETRATAEVREVFHISKVGLVAGCYIKNGTVNRAHLARLLRDDVVVRDRCKLASLRRFKDDVREARAGMECGVRLENFDDIKVGDVIELYEVIEVARTL